MCTRNSPAVEWQAAKDRQAGLRDNMRETRTNTHYHPLSHTRSNIHAHTLTPTHSHTNTHMHPQFFCSRVAGCGESSSEPSERSNERERQTHTNPHTNTHTHPHTSPAATLQAAKDHQASPRSESRQCVAETTSEPPPQKTCRSSIYIYLYVYTIINICITS